ncbi:hypothetical protein NDU88_004917 [Pleurodeles waltl]|uniref:Uncharacterized protein n=1 Tax=Pleurodeles waltl TaxID=8319 RepID=A0AAV7RKU1_PLEWA|nr:hypothetical protein NDU88_004917 [Pleurodeles waltl]
MEEKVRSMAHLSQYLSDHAPVVCEFDCTLLTSGLEAGLGNSSECGGMGDHCGGHSRNPLRELIRYTTSRDQVGGDKCGDLWTFQLELLQRETKFAHMQQQVQPSTVASRATLSALGHAEEVRDRFEKYTVRSYRQLLHKEGDTSARLLAWLLTRETLCLPLYYACDTVGRDVHSQRGDLQDSLRGLLLQSSSTSSISR